MHILNMVGHIFVKNKKHVYFSNVEIKEMINLPV